MFNEVDYFEEYLKSLKLEMIYHEHEPNYTGCVLDPNEYYTNAWETMVDMADEIIEVDWTESTLFKFCFPAMHAFYELCRKYSRRNKVKFRKNPYVVKAKAYVDSIFSGVNSDAFCWCLWTPRKIVKKKWDTVLIETAYYFDDFVPILDALYKIREYYAEQRDVLKQELHGKAEIIQMPSAEEETRKAA